MRRVITGLVLAAGAIAAGCGGSDTPAPPSNAAVQGTWDTGCLTVSGHDETGTLTFSGSNVSLSHSGFLSTDGSCTNETLVSVRTTTFSLGAEVAATLSSTAVTAQQLTVNDDTYPDYTIVYVNARVMPALLYLGDLAASAGLDGTAPGKRPTVLDAARQYRKQ